MSYRVEELLHQHGLLDRPKKLPIIEGEPRPRFYWRLLRNSIRNTIESVKKSDIKDVVIGHGIQYIRKLNHDEPIRQVLYNRKRKEYISVDTQGIRIFHLDGRRKDIVIPDEPLNGLLHAAHVDLYVSWVYGSDQIFLLSNEFQIISDSLAPSKIQSCIYNESHGEVVTSGPGCFSVWAFRYGARHLIPRNSTTIGLTNADQFDILVLEDTPSQSQKCFGVCGTAVAVFNTHECKLVGYHKDLHTRPISAAMFFNPLKYLITGAKDGSIKVWDSTFHLKLVFVGHSHKISSLAAYPYGPYFISASFDYTLRVWSIETCDEIDKVESDEPILGIGTVIRDDHFYSYSTYHAELWKIHHLHTEHTCVGFKVMGIKHTDHPGFPIRSVLSCNDSSVRIVIPSTGDVLTTLLMPLRRKLIDAAYAIEEDTLFAVFANGDIVKSDTTTNPCTILDQWSCPDKKKSCNYLLVYEYVVAANEGDFWAGMKRAIQNQSHQAGGTPFSKSNKTLLLGGRKDGYICVFDWDTGKVSFEIEAHGTKGVLTMVANSKYDQLISAGEDNIIKVWRLYPFAQEALAPLLSFFCAHTPKHMTVMKTNICVAFQEHSTATYSIVVHNLDSKNRFDHSPDSDHTDTVTGIACCQRLKLYASSSEDGTIKIWNEQNTLVRQLKLNATPHSIGFCSQKGDLLVGIGNHLHRIDHTAYLPKLYKFKLVCMRFNPVQDEEPLPIDEEALSKLSNADAKRLKGAKRSFKFEHYGDILSQDEQESLESGKREKEEKFASLEHREKELALIRDGALIAKHKPKSTKRTKKEAFEKYLKIFYDRPKIKPPDDQYFYLDDEVNDAMKGPKKPTKEVYRKEQFTGFFPPPETAKKAERKPDEPLKAQYPVRPDGFIPNSVLSRLLWPPEQKQVIEEAYKPPFLNPKQLEQLKKLTQVSSKRKFTRDPSTARSERTLILDYGDTDTSLKLEEEEEEEDDGQYTVSLIGSGKRPAKTPSKDPSSYLVKLQSVMEKPPSPKLFDDEDEQPVKPVDEEEPSPPALETHISQGPLTPGSGSIEASVSPPIRPKAARPLAPRKPIVKLIAKTPPESAPVTPSPAPPTSARTKTPPAQTPAPRTPTPPPTPIPEFIVQFRGVEWFEKYFPNCNENTLPKPWTLSAFTSMLLRVVKVAEYNHKASVTNAILMLHHQEGIPNNEAVSRAILAILNHPTSPPSCLDEHQKEFIRAGLKLLLAMQALQRELYMEVMMQYIEGDKQVRDEARDILARCGLHDPHQYFFREMDNWDVWNLDEKNRKQQLAKICGDWLDKWMASFKIHLSDTIERLKKGQGVSGKVSKSPATTSSSPAKSGRGILKSSPLDLTPDPLAGSPSKSVTVTFDAPPDPSVVDNVTYIEVINYFVEMELEKELDRMRQGRGERQKSTSDKGGAKNTVLVLPKLQSEPCLVRLGETHTSKCRPHRETSLTVDFRQQAMTSRGLPPRPGQLHGFPPALTLPMKSIHMNPFPSEIDFLYDAMKQANQPLIITLKMAPKYFIPSHSVVPPLQQIQEQY